MKQIKDKYIFLNYLTLEKLNMLRSESIDWLKKALI